MNLNYFKPKTKLAVRFSIFVKGVTGSIGAGFILAGYKITGLCILGVGAFVNEGINFFSDGTCEVIDEVIHNPEINCTNENK